MWWGRPFKTKLVSNERLRKESVNQNGFEILTEENSSKIMATTVLQRNLQNFRIIEKPFLIEMSESVGDIKNDLSHVKPMTQIQGKAPHEGSIASLASSTFIDQSEEQPLTKVHLCRYDDCHKFRETATNKETPGNPYSPLKNASLTLVIVLLIIWIIVYTIFNRLKLL